MSRLAINDITGSLGNESVSQPRVPKEATIIWWPGIR